jgi:hypothetical protein
MIRGRTVFVLGAGASAPYGFPLGLKLTDGIREELSRDSQFRRDVLDAYGRRESLKEFAELIGEAGRNSIDELLQWRQQWREVGKLAIARMLIPCERDERLHPAASALDWLLPQEPDGRWYRHLFNWLLTSRKGRCSIEANQLTVVTFNFDRSFERALFRFIAANCANDPAEARRLTLLIPVLHLHGQLGTPAWLSSDGALADRAYRPSDTGSDCLKMCAQQIRIVDEEVLDDPTLQKALDALADAEVVCFLGFSYHPLNLQKLQIGRLAGKEIRGTAYRMPAGRREAIQRTFIESAHAAEAKILLADPEDHILTFLEKTNVIYD